MFEYSTDDPDYDPDHVISEDWYKEHIKHNIIKLDESTIPNVLNDHSYYTNTNNDNNTDTDMRIKHEPLDIKSEPLVYTSDTDDNTFDVQSDSAVYDIEKNIKELNECDICHEQFTDSEHMHKGQKLHECQICRKLFAQSHDLSRHIVTPFGNNVMGTLWSNMRGSIDTITSADSNRSTGSNESTIAKKPVLANAGFTKKLVDVNRSNVSRSVVYVDLQKLKDPKSSTNLNLATMPGISTYGRSKSVKVKKV